MYDTLAYGAFEDAADAVIAKLPLRQRLLVRANVRRNRRGYLLAAFREFRNRGATPEEAPDLSEGDDGTSAWGDGKILEFFKWLIESGKIQPFMTFLVTEFLPKLFALILQIIEALSQVNVVAVQDKVAAPFIAFEEKLKAKTTAPTAAAA